MMKKNLKKIILICIFLPIITITPLIAQQNHASAYEPYGTDGSGGGSGGSSGGGSGPSTNTDCRYFLGLTSWDCNTSDPEDESTLSNNIWIIAANILTDIGIIAAYLVVGYVIYGGYLYMFSSGDPNKVSAGKKTLTNAFIGLAITILASIILGTIRIALIGPNANMSNCVNDPSSCANQDPAKLITNLINWVIGIAGLVSVVFIVIGGVGYMTSSGDTNKLQKAKNTITYALIGLAIVALSEIIVSFVSNIINDNKVSTIQINQTIATKEYHNEKK